MLVMTQYIQYVIRTDLSETAPKRRVGLVVGPRSKHWAPNRRVLAMTTKPNSSWGNSRPAITNVMSPCAPHASWLPIDNSPLAVRLPVAHLDFKAECVSKDAVRSDRLGIGAVITEEVSVSAEGVINFLSLVAIEPYV